MSTKIRLTWLNLETDVLGECVTMLPVTIGRGGDNDVTLDSNEVSRLHASLRDELGAIILHDEASRNGTFVNAERIDHSILTDGDRFQIASFAFTLQILTANETAAVITDPSQTVTVELSAATLIFDGDTDDLTPLSQAPPPTPAQAQFPPRWFEQKIIPLSTIQASEYPTAEATYLAIGGGLGSFAWVNGLRVSGVPASEITAVGFDPVPHGRYERLARQSQIPDHERLRSNSDACPDNLWGWPGYGVREIWQSLKKGELKNAARVSYQLFGEPTLIEPYTPRAGDVYRSIEREAERIGWSDIWRFGRVRAIRKTDDGRYIVAYSQSRDQTVEDRHRFIIAPYLHIAVGYPGVRFLPDLQAYRDQTHDFEKVVNAYEDHNHVYEHLLKHGGTVLIRGRGIVSSRIIQRITEARELNSNIKIIHLMRSPNAEGSIFGHTQRLVENHWELQPYNFPKACFGGDLKELLATVSDEERSRLLNLFGGTTTADRTDWRDMINAGLEEGWYEIRFGRVTDVSRKNDKIVTQLEISGDPQMVTTEFIIDATGLQASVQSHPLLADVIDCYELDLNIKGRLTVTDAFELAGLRNGKGRVYAAGAMTFGNHFAPVDSFIGLQYAALLSLDNMVSAQTPHLKRLNGWRSLAGWMRWARGVPA